QNNSELMSLIGEQVSQAQRHIDYHLARARAAAIARTPGMFTPVVPVVNGLVRTLKQLHCAKEVQFDLVFDTQQVAFQGSAQDLQEVLGNVLDNACKWAVQKVWIRIVEK